MAKSFHNIISDGTFEVNHQGEDVTLELPTWLKESKEILMDEQALVLWAQEHEIIHGLLHAGIQKIIIDLRAKARPNVDTKTGKSDSIVSDKNGAQERVDGFVVKPTLPPGAGKGTPEEQAKKAMEAFKKVNPEAFAAMLAGMQAE